MEQHINNVAAACFYNLRCVRQIHRRVSSAVTIRLVLALVTTRLDYCNVLLPGLPQTTLHQCLERAQNAAVQLIFSLSPRDHVSDALIQLHWLSICWSIHDKLATLVHDIHVGKCTSHSTDIV